MTEVADALLQIAVNWDQFHRKAITLRDHLAKKYTWEGCAYEALKACDFIPIATGPENAPPPSVLPGAILDQLSSRRTGKAIVDEIVESQTPDDTRRLQSVHLASLAHNLCDKSSTVWLRSW